MSDLQSPMPLRMLRTQEAARLVGLSFRTLEKYRTRGTGPTYIRIGGRVVYTPDDLMAWVRKGLRTSTSQEPLSGTASERRRREAPRSVSADL